MNTSVKIFLACTIGALIGSLFALRIDSAAWWVGALAGSLIGYFCYDIRTVFRAIPQAWSEVTGFHLTEQQWENVRGVAWWFALCMSWVSTTVFIVCCTNSLGMQHSSLKQIGLIPALFWCSLFMVNFAGLAISMVTLAALGTKQSRHNFLIGNPIMVHTYWLLRGIYIAIKKSPVWFPTAVAFVVKFIRIIHSNVRLLCGVDAMLGACIGYYCHNALVGALAGGVFGVLNYETLSKRVFHFVPNRTSS